MAARPEKVEPLREVARAERRATVEAMNELPNPTPGRCPHCGAGLLSGQETCLKCGLETRARNGPRKGARMAGTGPSRGLVAGAAAALAALVLTIVLLTGGGDDDEKKSPATSGSNDSERVAQLEECLGSPADLVPAFKPTVELAEAQGGGATAARFGRQKVQIIVFPDAQAAQIGFRNAQDQLIVLEQRDPTTFARQAAKMQIVGRQIQIVTRGDLDAAASGKVAKCLAE